MNDTRKKNNKQKKMDKIYIRKEKKNTNDNSSSSNTRVEKTKNEQDSNRSTDLCVPMHACPLFSLLPVPDGMKVMMIKKMMHFPFPRDRKKPDQRRLLLFFTKRNLGSKYTQVEEVKN
ncbi:hypothetical protein BO71DRAFT_37850 [Aspergillus ellipticus CBS 707.79]|uniref:Uncharacterized protein n=1 Tax=Aspergillus ellipticus CBS 707.79 TaxID=1448320 RepID=A0A319D3A2_9EURO|nr:hypothetical protein BO71DRAFT_37850 [Aspergillus ellipticus CBS 707.79]